MILFELVMFWLVLFVCVGYILNKSFFRVLAAVGWLWIIAMLLISGFDVEGQWGMVGGLLSAFALGREHDTNILSNKSWQRKGGHSV